VTFDQDIDPATVTPGSVLLIGRGTASRTLLDLSGIAVGASATASNQLEMTFEPELPDVAKYRVTLMGVRTPSGMPVYAGVYGGERVFTALRGDATGDLRVNATDVGAIRSLVVSSMDPSAEKSVRSDACTDGRINATDLGGVRGRVGIDARTIVDPYQHETGDCVPELPLPQVEIRSINDEPLGREINFAITNANAYPWDMLQDGRTDLSIYDQSGHRVYGFLMLSGAEEFQAAWVFSRYDRPAITSFTVELYDPVCDVRLRSAPVAVPQLI
jgi:hypothetical protein